MAEATLSSGAASSSVTDEYGGFWVRCLAYAADLSILTLALIAVAVPFAFLGGAGIAVYGLIAAIVPFAYFVWFTASERQATFGKQLCGLKIEHAGTGQRISILRSLGRELAKIVSSAVFLLGFLIVGFTRRKQGLHDFVATTVVVRDGPGRILLAFIVTIAGVVIPIIVIPLMFAALFAALMAMVMGGMIGATTGGDAKKQLKPVPRMEQSTQRPQTTSLPQTAGISQSQPGPAAGNAQEDPEAVYRKFHDATIARDFKELRKWGTAAIGDELAAMPAAERDVTIAFLGGMMPKSYTVTSKEISPDSAKATLRLSASVAGEGKPGTVLGTITLLKEGGMWKVLKSSWGGDQQSGTSPQTSALKPAVAAPARAGVPQSEPKPTAEAQAKPGTVTPAAVKSTPVVSATKPKAVARGSGSATAAAPSAPAMRMGGTLLPCVYKPVMTDEDIARCR